MRKIYTFVVLFIGILGFGQIVANDDIMPVTNGFIGNSNVGNIFTNDTFNGNAINLSLISVSVNNIIPPPAVNVPSVDENTGAVVVGPNTPAGTYTVSYTICEIANPTNCDSAVVTIYVSAGWIDAVNDNFTINGNGVLTPSVLLNDTFNGTPVNLNFVTTTPIFVPVGFTFNPDGTLTVSSNTPSGTYNIIYQICEILNPTNCDTANATITVNANQLAVNFEGIYVDFNNDGFVNVGDVINYQITLTNIGSTEITNIVSCQNQLIVDGGSIVSLPAGSSNSTTFTATHVLTQANINAASVFHYLCFCADNGVQNCLDGVTTTLPISDGIKLQAFVDTNTNGIKDSNESFYTGGHFSYSLNGGTATYLYSGSGIVYLYENNPTNTYNLSYVTPNTNVICTTSFSNITVANGSGITTYNFPISIIQNTDLSVYLGNYSAPPRPGFTYQNIIQIYNPGNQPISSGTLTFTNGNNVNLLSCNNPNAVVTPTGLTYTFSNLAPNAYIHLLVTMQVPTIPTVNLGDLVTNTASVTIPNNDINPNNNTSNLTQVIVGSYDPNDKQEHHGGQIEFADFATDDYLTYTIRFENTGTAEAINVSVEDVLDNQLDETTIRMVAASHDYVLQRIGSALTWKFDGINLPPSVPDTQIGHGYITFQVKPKAGYAIGDIIPNTAEIYFDFNPAIVTNTCTTEFVETLSNPNFVFSNLNFFPNPVKNNLTISNTFLIDSIKITSILGQNILSQNVNSLQTEIDMSELSKGIYFVKIISEGQEKTVKIVKE
ncbi:MAG: T9SS type A sorting domain-containing protein [Flavobacteriales bacterium]|nr:T9SS type A sorting domain-containing protein [Flavobacteriales bacterium]